MKTTVLQKLELFYWWIFQPSRFSVYEEALALGVQPKYAYELAKLNKKL